MRHFLIVLAVLAGMSQAYAQDFRPNYLVNIHACKRSEPFIDMLDAARKGDDDQASIIWRANVMAGDCKQFQLIMYQPEAIVQRWDDDDGSGSPGAILAGWLLGPEGEKILRAFVWVTPDLLKAHFRVKEDGA